MASSPKHPIDASPAPADPVRRDQELHAWMIQYGPGIRRFLLKRVSAVEVDDLVQEVFLSLQARGAASAIENVEGYLFRTAVSVLARRGRRRTWQWGRQEQLESAPEELDDMSPERILMGKEAVGRVVTALKGLPRRRAQAFALSRFEHLSNEDVARRMGISVKAVEDLLRRALQQLLVQLGPDR
jgi:RNA polymerase sigma-70 factor (ECF subfamily)